ncbi:DNA glycosylase AlkZ-like family protein [Spirochaeta cellobiosiphila]|uniref:DNA glycosylase AlkZ-like family protein n=1 Tax=Spirochaeta cellobiosiphila TaxID=504483 RepID=UPI000414C3A6|nr:crosslink repair DNA glycosylase YcaQ family protein [Spirochaeta cellobiosiphila]
MINLTPTEAIHYLLSYQNINTKSPYTKDEEIQDFIRKVGCIQYDPLSRIAKNADLVLNNRVKNYKEKRLDKLLYKDRVLFDGWDKNMSIMALDDWKQFNWSRDKYKSHYKDRAKQWEEAANQIFHYLEKHEYLCSSDIKTDITVDWAWAPTNGVRAALESLYHTGHLGIHHRKGTRKYYGLIKDLYPEEALGEEKYSYGTEDFNDWYVRRRINSLGLLWDRGSDVWLGCPLKKADREEGFHRLIEKQILEPVTVRGINAQFYVDKHRFDQQQKGDIKGKTSFIAPLDNLIWDRKLVQELWGFHYKWEVYTPLPERKYAYYVLPVLYKDRFVGRFEPIRNGKDKELLIQNWWWEDHIKPTKAMKESIIREIKSFMKFLELKSLSIGDPVEESWLRSFATSGFTASSRADK